MLALSSGPLPAVPLHNYAGRFGAVFVFMLVCLLFASRYAEQPRKDPMENWVVFCNLPVYYYALIALGIIITPLVAGVAFPYASPANYVGTDQALEVSLTLIAIFVMGDPVVFALCRLYLNRTQAIP